MKPALNLGAWRPLDGGEGGRALWLPAEHLVTHGVVLGMTTCRICCSRFLSLTRHGWSRGWSARRSGAAQSRGRAEYVARLPHPRRLAPGRAACPGSRWRALRRWLTGYVT